MQVHSVGPAFCGKAKRQEENDNSGGAIKAAASIIPGLGQAIDGRYKEAAVFFGGLAAISTGVYFLGKNVKKEAADVFGTMVQNMKKMAKNVKKEAADAFKAIGENMKKIPMAKTAGVVALGLAFVGTYVANIVDAYDGNRKPKSKETKEE